MSGALKLTAFNDEFNLGREQGEEDYDYEPSELLEELGTIADNNNDENNVNRNERAVCDKLSDKIDRIEEQESRDSLDEQAHELRQQIEAMLTNLPCQ